MYCKTIITTYIYTIIYSTIKIKVQHFLRRGILLNFYEKTKHIILKLIDNLLTTVNYINTKISL